MQSLFVERQESALGSWIQASWSPPAGDRLHGRVRSIWYFDGVLMARRQRVFPDGSIEIIVQLDEPHRPGQSPDERFPPVCITGLRLAAEVVVAPPGRTRVVGLILSPPCAHVVLNESLASLTGITADLDDLVGRAASELGERLESCSAPGAVVDEARAWLSDRLDRARDLRATFRERFGTTPKRYERILRFRRTLDALAFEGGSLSEISLAQGYYDQAHFSNEFREHAGMTPTAYLQSIAFPGSTSLADA